MSHALESAWRKGRQAREEGLSEGACPYKDLRKSDGRLTWSRAFRSAWFSGWNGEMYQGGSSGHERPN